MDFSDTAPFSIVLSHSIYLPRDHRWFAGRGDSAIPQFLLALDFGQKHVLPILRTVHVVRSQPRRQTVTLAVKQEQGMIADRLKMPVVGTVLLFAIDRDFRRVHF